MLRLLDPVEKPLRQREVASRWPSTYGQDDEADALK